jgi:hypothetical protein
MKPHTHTLLKDSEYAGKHDFRKFLTGKNKVWGEHIRLLT